MEVCLPVPEAVCRLRWSVQHNNPYAYDSYSAYSYNSSNPIFGSYFSSIVIAILLVIALLASLYTIFVGNAVSVGGCRYFMENRETSDKCFKGVLWIPEWKIWKCGQDNVFPGFVYFIVDTAFDRTWNH
ncbi:MAG: hypothetical protein ACLTKE_08075 [Coprococcus sp.]